MPLQWRDYALNYKGRLQWDGKSPSARLNLRALDTGNGRLVAEGTFNPMIIMDAPGRSVLSFQVPLPNGDSRTAGAHTHAVNLVFEQQAGGASLFKRNCMAPGRPDLCFE